MNKSEVFVPKEFQMITPTQEYYPDHNGGKFAPIEATTVATWKARSFLENLAVDAEGAVFVSVYSHNRVDRYDPATGTTATFAKVPAPPMGLMLYVTTDGGFLIPHESGVQDAKLVRMEVSDTGWPLLEGG